MIRASSRRRLPVNGNGFEKALPLGENAPIFTRFGGFMPALGLLFIIPAALTVNCVALAPADPTALHVVTFILHFASDTKPNSTAVSNTWDEQNEKAV